MPIEKGAYQEIADSIIQVLNSEGSLEFGELNKRIHFVSSAVREVLSDLVDGDIIVREKHGTKPYINSVMLRNVYKYKVKTLKP